MINNICMNCKGKNINRFLDLGYQPNGNHFPDETDFDVEPKFPFAMCVCTDCWQVQIEEFPPVEFMFSNHPYITGLNIPVVNHFNELVSVTLKKFKFEKNSLVIDIGSNDGTLLNIFQKAGMRILGIDPNKRTGEIAKKSGVTVCETFWDENCANAIQLLNLKPDIITATAVFYHVADIHSFVRGLATVMHEGTIFITQCVYLKDVIDKIQFDHFYHEHTMLHSIAPLKHLFSNYGLKIIDIDFYDVHGGSFVLYVARDDSNYAVSPKLENIIADEINSGLQNLETFFHFSRQVEEKRYTLKSLLMDLVSQGKKIYALGAPLKGSTLLNYCNIGPDLVEVAIEVNTLKIDRYTPGTHIPIVNEKYISIQPDYYLILSWNFLDYFIEKYDAFLRAGGKFIVPHPNIKVISYSHTENL